MSTVVVFNGSKYAGQEPDSVEALLRVLCSAELLHPSFDGCFVRKVSVEIAEHYGVDAARAVHFAGNFLTVSHAFSIFTDEGDVIQKLSTAVRANTTTDAYRVARAEHRADVARKEAAASAFSARHNSRR